MSNEVRPEEIVSILEDGQYEAMQELVEHVHPVDILTAVHEREDARQLLDKLPTELLADIVDEEEVEDKYQLLMLFSKRKQAEILNCMASDELADLLNELEDAKQNELLKLLRKDNREEAQELMKYDSETAGGLMATEFLAIYEHKTVLETIQYLRKEVDAETTYYLYVIDKQRHLKGVVSLRDIITSDFEVKIQEILNPNVIVLFAQQDQEEVARQFDKYGFLLMPVVDNDHRLIGVVTVDDVIEVITEEATEDIHHLAGINKEEKVDGTLFESVKSRLPWLCVNLVTAILASSVINLFSDTISKIVALSAVMTIISGMGGNAGTQSLTIVVRGLSLGEVDKENAMQILRKETGVGLVTGIVIGIFVSLIALYYEFNPMFGVVAGVAMILNMICATLAGYSVPLILQRMKIDPALASGVFVTTVTDVLGFFFFLGLATLAMPYL